MPTLLETQVQLQPRAGWVCRLVSQSRKVFRVLGPVWVQMASMDCGQVRATCKENHRVITGSGERGAESEPQGASGPL